MIVSSAPLRVSFFGGGSDIDTYYQQYGGAFLSMAINKRVSVVLNKTETGNIKVHYSKTEIVSNSNLLQHPILKNTLQHYGIHHDVEICSFANIPTHGTGLGSSSTFTVSLIKAINEMQQKLMNTRDIAETACMIEIEQCLEPIGKQDQYAAAFGGLNFYVIDRNGFITVSKNILTYEQEITLTRNLYLVYSGQQRPASSILQDQKNNLDNRQQSKDAQQKIVDLAYESKELLINEEFDTFGLLLDEAWVLKKNLSGLITNPAIDNLYNLGKTAGATGAKLLGAGGGGYVLFYVPLENKAHFENKFSGKYIQPQVDQEGVKIDFSA